MSLHVAVLMGGWSAEREVSLTTAKGIIAALETLGHRITAIDMDRDVAIRLRDVQPDVVFNALHGTPGEDGSVQGLLELMNIPYTHSGVTASAIAINKSLCKKLLQAAGLRMPEGVLVASESVFEQDPLARPYVLKPNNEGSSVGVAIVHKDSNIGHPISKDTPGPWHDYEELLAEKFIPGRELTVAVLDDVALGVTELKPSVSFFDYNAKYTAGVTQHILPAEIHPSIIEEAKAMALAAHRLLGCRGVSRADFRYDDTQGEPGALFLLEINTQPGMTPLSLAPEQARFCGISYESLVARLIESALVDHRQRNARPGSVA